MPMRFEWRFGLLGEEGQVEKTGAFLRRYGVVGPGKTRWVKVIAGVHPQTAHIERARRKRFVIGQDVEEGQATIMKCPSPG
jgi:hypothetical protein